MKQCYMDDDHGEISNELLCWITDDQKKQYFPQIVPYISTSWKYVQTGSLDLPPILILGYCRL